MNTQTILTIAAKHSAYADSRVCIRGQDDIVAFVKEVLNALYGSIGTRTTISADDLRRHQDEGALLKGTIEINPEPLPMIQPERDEQCDWHSNIPSSLLNDAYYSATSEHSALQRQRDYMLESLRRIAAAPIDHGRYAELVRAAAKETVEFIDSGVL